GYKLIDCRIVGIRRPDLGHPDHFRTDDECINTASLLAQLCVVQNHSTECPFVRAGVRNRAATLERTFFQRDGVNIHDILDTSPIAEMVWLAVTEEVVDLCCSCTRLINGTRLVSCRI